MKYFRAFPWAMQLLFFLGIAFTLLLAAEFILPKLLLLFGHFSIEEIVKVDKDSPRPLVNAAIAVQAIGNVFCYLLPAVLFAYLCHPEPRKYLGLVKPGKSIHWLLVILVMLGAIPLLSGLETLVGKIDFGPKVKEAQQQNDNIFGAFLDMPDFLSFLKVFTAMAIVPAFGEELFFRGVLLRLAKKKARTMLYPIVFTAAVFALSHSNVYGLVSIFLAGVLLAVIYNLTGSIWCSIVAHMFFNGFQIILSYAGHNSPRIMAFLNDTSVPVSFIIGGAIVFGVSFWLLLKNKTPLPAGWTDDFPPAVPAAQDWDFMEKQ